MYHIEYVALNYYHSPVSDECLCIGVLFHNLTTGQRDFKYISNFQRFHVFDDEADVDFVKLYLSAVNTSKEALMKKEDFDSLGYEISVGDLVMADVKEDDRILFSAIKLLYDRSEDEINSAYLYSGTTPEGNRVKQVLPIVITNAEGSYFEYAVTDSVSSVPADRYMHKVGSNTAFKYDKDEKVMKKLNAKDLSPYKYGEDTATRAIMIIRYGNLRGLYVLDEQ